VEKRPVLILNVSISVIKRANLLLNENVHNSHSPPLSINVPICTRRMEPACLWDMGIHYRNLAEYPGSDDTILDISAN
jgi:hypothetical protein